MTKLKIFKLCFFLLALTLLLPACSHQPPIPEDKFIKVYIDLIAVQDTLSSNQLTADSLKNIVFRNHNITIEEYGQTISYYNSSPERWEEFFDKAIAYAEKLRAKADSIDARGK